MIQVIREYPCNIREIVKKAHENGETKLEIASKGVMFSVPRFYKECVNYNIQPVIGCEFPLETGNSITLFAKNNEGYKNLMFLSSMACTTSGTLKNPKLSERFLDINTQGLTENPDEVCSFNLEFSGPQLPDFKIPKEHKDAESYLCYETVLGLANLILNRKIPSELYPKYEKRLVYELSVIKKHQFANYFLIVKEYMNWANENGFGPCILRGNAASSLVLYYLGLSDIDPIANGLVFESFINPRVKLPDIDIEVPIGSRDKIYEYLEKTYGKGHVGKAAELSFDGKYIGCNPHTIIISKSNLADVVPVFFDENGKLTTQYQSTELEYYGPLTFDIYESINISILKDAAKEIPQLNINAIPFDDKATFELFSNEDIDGIVGFKNSYQSMQNLKKFKPQSIEDLAIFYATDRPDCEDIISLIIHNKDNNTPCEPTSDCIKPILEQTYGCFVYQEQLMQAISTFSGCSLSKADMIRKVLAKRKKRMYEDYFEKFSNTCISNGHTKEEYEKLFNYLETIARKLFLKSHALEFARIAYEVTYIRAHYPEFFERGKEKYKNVDPNLLNYCEYECLNVFSVCEVENINTKRHGQLFNKRKIIDELSSEDHFNFEYLVTSFDDHYLIHNDAFMSIEELHNAGWYVAKFHNQNT